MQCAVAGAQDTLEETHQAVLDAASTLVRAVAEVHDAVGGAGVQGGRRQRRRERARHELTTSPTSCAGASECWGRGGVTDGVNCYRVVCCAKAIELSYGPAPVADRWHGLPTLLGSATYFIWRVAWLCLMCLIIVYDREPELDTTRPHTHTHSLTHSRSAAVAQFSSQHHVTPPCTPARPPARAAGS